MVKSDFHGPWWSHTYALCTTHIYAQVPGPVRGGPVCAEQHAVTDCEPKDPVISGKGIGVIGMTEGEFRWTVSGSWKFG